MSITPMDLDSSLDDLIKKRKSNTQNKKQGHNKKQQQQQQQQKTKARPALHVKSKVAKVTKPQRTGGSGGGGGSGINSRLSTSTKVSGPLFTSKNKLFSSAASNKKQAVKYTPTVAAADPSQIIITKAIPPGQRNKKNNIDNRIAPVATSSPLAGRLGKQVVVDRVEHNNIYQRSVPTSMVSSVPVAPASAAAPSNVISNFSIRGRSSIATNNSGLSIRGESGPTLVLVTGLDPGTNDDDVKCAFECFGNILSCEVLRDRQGRSFGEAEIEFSTKNAALDCIAKLDNQMADGHYLRVILRENKPKPPVFVPKPIQSVISTPSYTASGKMYSDQILSRYDIRRQ